jgi:hypothetical protein
VTPSEPSRQSTTLDAGELVVEFCGETRRLAPGEALRFGRRADLCIDENPYLHRVVGRFVSRQGLWWIQNHGARTVLEIRDLETASRQTVAPGQQAALVLGRALVCFTAGPTAYELEVSRHGGEVVLDEVGEPAGTATIDFGVVPLSAEQHLLLVALCEPRLRSGSDEVPTNQAVADRLGWTLTKVNRKLDHLCAKLAREGVRGLRGGPDSLAMDRRQTLIDHALTAGLVEPDDLGLLSRRV